VLYNYQCNVCDYRYERSNPIAHRSKGGRCPSCTSKDTKQMTREDASKLCEKRDDIWYCTSIEDYHNNKFKNAIPAKEYKNDKN